MSDAARAYSCPSCGASVDEQARACIYCRAPLATVRCAACFQLNVPEALHCSGCGRETGLEPVGRDAEIHCPHCRIALAAFDQTEGALYDCAQCGGQFVEHPALRELVDRHDLPRVVMAPPSRRAIPVGPVKYVPCPVCASMMNRKNFGGTSGVIVDVCRAHGTWFDLGELPRVLAFVDQGGLAIERQRKLDEAAEARRKHVADAAAAAMSHPVSTHDLEDHGRLGGSLIDLLLR